MAVLDRLMVRGVRSFSPADENVLQFAVPLTLIVGANGTGKTTIIESLKYAATGALPPQSKGAAFLYDPKMAGELGTQAEVRLRFTNAAGEAFVCRRLLQATQRGGKLFQKTLETILEKEGGDARSAATNHSDYPRHSKESQACPPTTEINEPECLTRGTPQGEAHSRTICTRLVEIDKLVPLHIGISPALLESVVFCHQEESAWPLGDSKSLKDRLDALFATEEYSKALKALKDSKKGLLQELRVVEERLTFLGKEKARRDDTQERLRRLEEDAQAARSRQAAEDAEAQRLRQTIGDLQVEIAGYDRLDENYKIIRAEFENCKSLIRNFSHEVLCLEDIPGAEATAGRASLESALVSYQERLAALIQEADLKGAELQMLDNAQQRVDAALQANALRQQQCEEISRWQAAADVTALQLTKIENEIRQKVAPFISEIQRGEVGSTQNSADMRSEHIISTERHAKHTAGSISTSCSSLQTSESYFSISIFITQLNEYEKRVVTEKQKAQALLDSQNQLESAKMRLLTEFPSLSGISEDSEKESLSEDAQPRMECKTPAEGCKSLEEQASDVHNEIYKKEMDVSAAQKLAEIAQCVIRVNNTRTALEETFKEVSARQAALTRFEKAVAHADEQAAAKNKAVAMLKQANATVEAFLNSDSGEVRKLLNLAGSRPLSENTANTEPFQTLRLLSSAGTMENVSNAMQSIEKELEELNKRCAASTNAVAIYQNFQDLGRSRKKCPLCKTALDERATDELSKRLSRVILQLPHEHEALLGRRRLLEERLQAMQAAAQNIRLAMQSTSEAAPEGFDEALNTQQKALHALCEARKQCEHAKQCLIKAEGRAEFLKQQDLHNNEELARQNAQNVPNMPCIAHITDPVEQLSILTAYMNEAQETLKNLKIKASAIQEQQKAAGAAKHRAQYKEIIAQLAKLLPLSLKSKVAELMRKADDLVRTRVEIEALAAQITRFRDEQSALLKKIASSTATFNQNETPAVNLEDLHLNKNILAQITEQLTALQSKDSEQASQQEDEPKRLKKDSSALHITRIADVLHQIREIISAERKKCLAAIAGCQHLRTRAAIVAENIALARAKDRVLRIEAEFGDFNLSARRNLLARVERLRTQEAAAAARTAHAMGEAEQLEHSCARIRHDLETTFAETHHRYVAAAVELRTTEMAIQDIDACIRALDRAITEFHATKLEEINAILRELWSLTYHGTDIEYIEICAEAPQDTRAGGYAVTMSKRGVSMDMRGRCSAGQKTIACILIRLALVEAFARGRRVLALDEPTTNLDRENAVGLAAMLAGLLAQQRELQLVIITHDEDFVSRVGRGTIDFFYRLRRDARGNSHIERHLLRSSEIL